MRLLYIYLSLLYCYFLKIKIFPHESLYTVYTDVLTSILRRPMNNPLKRKISRRLRWCFEIWFPELLIGLIPSPDWVEILGIVSRDDLQYNSVSYQAMLQLWDLILIPEYACPTFPTTKNSSLLKKQKYKRQKFKKCREIKQWKCKTIWIKKKTQMKLMFHFAGFVLAFVGVFLNLKGYKVFDFL